MIKNKGSDEPKIIMKSTMSVGETAFMKTVNLMQTRASFHLEKLRASHN